VSGLENVPANHAAGVRCCGTFAAKLRKKKKTGGAVQRSTEGRKRIAFLVRRMKEVSKGGGVRSRGQLRGSTGLRKESV